MINAQFPSLKEEAFPEVAARSVQVKIKNRWVTVFNIILTNTTCAGREGMNLNQWPEYAAVVAEYPVGTQFRITKCISIMPWSAVLNEMIIGQRVASVEEIAAAKEIFKTKGW